MHFKAPELDDKGIDSIFSYVDRTLIEGIDALDNGIRIENGKIPLMNISTIIAGFNPTWYSEKPDDEEFNEAVYLSGDVLRNTIKNKFAVLKSMTKVAEAFEKRKNSRVIVLDTYCPFREALRNIDNDEEVLYVVYPDRENYAMQTVRGKNGEDRKPLPVSWAGKRNNELADVTGVEDAVFCHTGRFIAIAKSLNGILKMAEVAIAEPEKKKWRFGELLKHIFYKK